ncbi:MAG: selenocysteine-specific elongation factor [Verrucomicrobiota bacterium]|jgi:selenocysteine-specific elongation factor
MELKRFILATAGHVDHGKSALVRALTGTDPDRLPEEKLRGITIELGFAQLELPTPDALLSVGIVDVPGHEDFIKNMVAGVGSIDLALLVVATDDGWMPQTEEHLQILIYLGVRRIIVALTKIDLVESEAAAAEKVRSQLRDTPFTDAAIVSTSITTGNGIEELKAQLAREFSALVPQRDLGKPRLAVDRAFTLRGIGTVVTGTLVGGTLRRGQAVVVQPKKIPAHIRAIQNHNREVEEIGPGARTALSLPDVAVAREKNNSGVWRGDVITLPEFGEASMMADVMLSRSSRLPPKTRSIKHGAAVRMHHGSANFGACVFFQSAEELRAGETVIAQMRFEAPVFVFAGDRFVIRDGSEQSTLAGGVVLDPDASVRDFRSAAQREFLARRARAPQDAGVFAATEIARDRAVKRNVLLAKASFGAAEIAQSIKSANVIERSELVIDAKWWKEVLRQAEATIDAEHAAHPNHAGLALSELRQVLARELPVPEIFDVLASELCRSGFVRTGETIARATHRPSLPPQLQSAAARIRTALAAKKFDPPSRAQLAPDATSQQVIHFLCDSGEVVELNAEVVLATEQFAKMREATVAFLRKNNSGSASELRELLGTSRRVIIPFLERLDREGVTRRIDDKRVLSKPN